MNEDKEKDQNSRAATENTEEPFVMTEAEARELGFDDYFSSREAE